MALVDVPDCGAQPSARRRAHRPPQHQFLLQAHLPIAAVELVVIARSASELRILVSSRYNVICPARAVHNRTLSIRPELDFQGQVLPSREGWHHG